MAQNPTIHEELHPSSDKYRFGPTGEAREAVSLNRGGVGDGRKRRHGRRSTSAEQNMNEHPRATDLIARMCRALLGVLAFGAATAYAFGAVGHRTEIPAVKTAVAPPLDPSLRSPLWQKAVTARDFIDFSTLRAASMTTTAYLLYDDRNLYVAFRCEQRVPITASQTIDNASVSTDDHVTIWIDTSGTGARTYAFSATPHGVHSESSSENARYAPPWRSVAAAYDGGYTVMMVIPLSDLRSQAGPNERWRINFERYVAATNSDYSWAFEPSQTNASTPQNWPLLTGIHLAANATRPHPYADVYALESAGSDRDRFQNGIGQFKRISPRVAGIDVTYPVTDTLALVGTYNPDFSNVEEDQTAISPQEFARVYNEYRPFFAQGAQYINAVPQISLFGGGDSMFYTPSIGIFNSGLKAEGTIGRNAIGALNVAGPSFDDAAYGYAYTTPDNALTLSSEGVFARHDALNDDTVGFGASQTNRHSGQFTDAFFGSESGMAVVNAGPSRATIFAEGLRNAHILIEGIYQNVGSGYAPIDGYTAINDIRGPGAIAQYSGVGSARSGIQSYSLSVFGDRYLDRLGNVHEADVNAFYRLSFKNLFSISGFAGPSELGQYTYNRRQVSLGYGDNTPSPMSVSYTWGPFGGLYVQQTAASITRVIGPYGISFEYDGNVERLGAGGPIRDSQWLRRVAFSRTFGRNASIAINLRSINGTGGFATPGTNVALLYQQRFANQDMLYLEYGTPAAPQTLHRFIVKYVFHVGGATGT